MNDWKSPYGVSDEAAANAGVFGAPTSTWQRDQAIAEENRLRNERNAQSYAPAPMAEPYVPPPQYVPGAPYTPSARARDYRSTPAPPAGGKPSLARRIVMLLFVWPLVVMLIGSVVVSSIYWLPVLVAATSSQLDTSAPVLSTAHYERLSEEARRLSSQSTSRLYEARLKGASPDWNTLDQRQRQAVAAAWIRYTRNPSSFSRLRVEQRTYIFAAFRSYLAYLAQRGDQHAAADLRRLATTAG